MSVDLKAYTTRAKELEVAIYTQRELMRQHEELLQRQRPLPPQKEYATPPPRPAQPPRDTSLRDSLLIALGFILFGVFTSFSASLDIELAMVFTLVCVGIGVALIVQGYKKDAKHKKEMEAFNQSITTWNNQMGAYYEQQSRLDSEYSIRLERYQSTLTERNNRYTLVMQQHREALASLELAMKAFYAQDVVFPKYRNLVAMTTINEYLMSGRCTELEGPNGAYNLYEMELRQNIVIAQLSNILKNLEQIKSNQYTLYQELHESNRLIREILNEARCANATAKLTMYFTGISALADTSPKFSAGIIV